MPLASHSLSLEARRRLWDLNWRRLLAPVTPGEVRAAQGEAAGDCNRPAAVVETAPLESSDLVSNATAPGRSLQADGSDGDVCR
jgi:hypothetical protein